MTKIFEHYKVCEEEVPGMVFNSSRLLVANMPGLPSHGKTVVSVYRIQDVSDFYRLPDSEFSKKYGISFEDFASSDLDLSFACKHPVLSKDYSFEFFVQMYEKAIDECEEYVMKAEEMLFANPQLLFLLKPQLLDRLLTKRFIYRVGWLDIERALVFTKHYKKYFGDLWVRFISMNLPLPKCVCLYIVDFVLKQHLGESMLSMLLRTHDYFLNEVEESIVKGVSRHVSIDNGFIDNVCVEI